MQIMAYVVSFGGGRIGGLALEKLPTMQQFEVALADETSSQQCHEGNDLVNVTFISLSVGNSSIIVVFFVLASETYNHSFHERLQMATHAENHHTSCHLSPFHNQDTIVRLSPSVGDGIYLYQMSQKT